MLARPELGRVPERLGSRAGCRSDPRENKDDRDHHEELDERESCTASGKWRRRRQGRKGDFCIGNVADAGPPPQIFSI